MILLPLPVNYKLFFYLITIPFFLNFCFIQQGIPRFRIFSHSVFKDILPFYSFHHSSVLPFYQLGKGGEV